MIEYNFGVVAVEMVLHYEALWSAFRVILFNMSGVWRKFTAVLV